MSNKGVKRRQDFLLSFFDDQDEYQEREINGFWLIKHWDGKMKRWRVNIFTGESYKRYKEVPALFEEDRANLEILRSF